MVSKVATAINARDRITSLERGLRVLRAFREDAPEMTPADVARRTDLPRAATRRILLTLSELGYATSDGKYFRLTPRVLDLSHGYLAKARVSDVIDPVLREAVEEIRDSCILAIRDGNESVTIACVDSSNFGAVSVNVGLRIPLHVSTPGRIYLASLPINEQAGYLSSVKLLRYTANTITNKALLREELIRIGKHGYAIGREEWELGVYALAVPVLDRAGRTIASVGCVGNVARIATGRALDQRIAALRRVSERIAEVLPEAPDLAKELHRNSD
jgi:IclR family pca regulon transcriptional regulator